MNRLIDALARRHHYIGIQGNAPVPKGQPGIRPPLWVHEGPVYAVFVRAFSGAGTLAEVTGRIAELKEFGIKTIWLLPICPIGEKDRKGRRGSPYAIRDHRRIAPELGQPGDFKNLVDTVHRHDMRIIMDFVGNHAARDHLHTGLLQTRNSRSPADWSDVADFDFSRRETRRYLADTMLQWVAEYGIDGFRCDVAGLVPDDFWQAATARLLELKPDLFLLAEWQRPQLQQRCFHAGYDWVFYLILKEIRNKERSAGDIIRWEKEVQETYPEGTLLLRFTENHDLPRTADIFGPKSFPVYAGLVYCLNGVPLIYAGQERGIGNRPDLFEKDPVPWEKGHARVYEYYRRLIRIRRDHPALSHGSVEQISGDSDEVLIFRKFSRNDNLIVVANFGGRKSAALPDKCEGPYRDLISGARFSSGRMVLDGHRLYILIAE